jgi:hypothetical protein
MTTTGIKILVSIVVTLCKSLMRRYAANDVGAEEM